MKKELSQKSRQRILVGAWILLILQAMALIGIVSGGDKLYPAVEVFLHRPTAAALGRALGHFVGINTLALVALIAGFTLWRHGKSKESKTIITASTIAIILSSILVIR